MPSTADRRPRTRALAAARRSDRAPSTSLNRIAASVDGCDPVLVFELRPLVLLAKVAWSRSRLDVARDLAFAARRALLFRRMRRTVRRG
jgi:hypothetical protein